MKVLEILSDTGVLRSCLGNDHSARITTHNTKETLSVWNPAQQGFCLEN